MLSFDRLSSVKDPTDLARGLIGRDPYDDSLRVCAFLELSADRDGPFGILNLLNRIQKGRKAMGYGPPKFDHLVRAAPESISELVGTIVHSLGQRLARAGCSARHMQDVADAISLILALSGDRDMGQVLFRVLPKLRRGEITLSFSLLLATGLATDESCAEMWDLFSHALARPPITAESQAVTAVLAFVLLLYTCGEGAEALFPWLWRELTIRRLCREASHAWQRVGGEATVWANLVSKTKRLWATQRAMCAQAATTSGGADSDTGDESESTGSIESS